MQTNGSQALRALCGGIVDYAGLFPPAKLDMAPTVQNYHRYRGGRDAAAPAWMLGRLVVPVARFAEFEAAVAGLLPVVDGPTHDDAWAITALTAAAGDAGLAADLDAIDRFNDEHAREGAGAAYVDCIELKAPSASAIDTALDLMPDDLYPYFEIDWASDPRGMIAALAGLDAGAKIRTGGLVADAHPSPEAVARFIAACASAEVPFKATAGLHHPLRHAASDVGCRQHGFLNVFAGSVLLFGGQIDEATLATLLADESAASFRFADDGLAWRDRRAPIGQIRAARERFAHAFGSCSYTEPLDDLRRLGLLTSESVAR
jgi:hypothetical protein